MSVADARGMNAKVRNKSAVACKSRVSNARGGSGGGGSQTGRGEAGIPSLYRTVIIPATINARPQQSPLLRMIYRRYERPALQLRRSRRRATVAHY